MSVTQAWNLSILKEYMDSLAIFDLQFLNANIPFKIQRAKQFSSGYVKQARNTFKVD